MTRMPACISRSLQLILLMGLPGFLRAQEFSCTMAIVGATTRLIFCDGYTDFLGHISDGQNIRDASYAAVTTGLFYRDFDFSP